MDSTTETGFTAEDCWLIASQLMQSPFSLQHPALSHTPHSERLMSFAKKTAPYNVKKWGGNLRTGSENNCRIILTEALMNIRRLTSLNIITTTPDFILSNYSSSSRFWCRKLVPMCDRKALFISLGVKSDQNRR